MTMTSQRVTYAPADNQVAVFEIESLEGFEPAGIGDVVGRVRVAGRANWVVTRASAEGNFEVALSWQPDSTVAVVTASDMDVQPRP
jgi:hypothetical protein